MKKVAVVAIAIVWLCGEPRAQRWSVSQGALNERVVGLLDLPDVTGEYADDACQPKATAQVFGEPSAAAAPIGTITMRQHREFGCALLFTRAASAVEEELPTDESGYETAAAVVHERRGQWLRIALPRGTGWIQRLTTTDFLPYPQLLVQRMTYLRSDWDGDVRMEPGGLSVSLPSAWKG